MKREVYLELRDKALAVLQEAGIALTESEKGEIEVADFGLNDVYHTGLQSIVYINTDRCCAKEMILLPQQTCPEHQHPPVGEYPGKEETFRCRRGKVYLYVEGTPTADIKAVVPEGSEEYYTVFHEIVLNEGEQYTLYPNTKHWFQAGEAGAVVSEFSTHCYDEFDIFTDTRISRLPVIE